MGFTKRHINICLQEGYDKAFIEPNGDLHALYFMKDGEKGCMNEEGCGCDDYLQERCSHRRGSFTLVVEKPEGKKVCAAIWKGVWPMHSPAWIRDEQGYHQRWFKGVREAARAALDNGFF
ncbi:MAG: hypothetical protein C3F19_13380 [Rhodocyclales bacterium]|jgi:hypothetical protein|nr:MAG: hypothetical protein C3F19_13380 [Rhodocyclales bacterium]